MGTASRIVIAERVMRFDIGTLHPPVETPDGFLRATGYASRVGVFDYLNADGTIRKELRLPEEVGHPDSLASYEGKPMTMRHPGGLVTPRNAKRHSIGTVLKPAVMDGDHVAVDMIFTDETAIAMLKSGKMRQLSSGYRLALERTAGFDTRWGEYHFIQRHIDINHLALLELGRAGATAAVKMDAALARSRVFFDMAAITSAQDRAELFRLDGAAAVMVGPLKGSAVRPTAPRVNSQASPTPKGTMPDPKKTTQDPKKKDPPNEPGLLEAAVAEAANEKARADSAEVKLAAETKRADAAQGEVLGLQKQVKDLEAERIDQSEVDELTVQLDALKIERDEAITRADAAENPKAITERVKNRLAIEKVALSILEESNFDDLNDRDLMAMVIEKRGGEVHKDHSEDVVRGQFLALTKGFIRSSEALARLRAKANPVNQDGSVARAKSPRDEYVDRQNNAWKRDPAQKGA